MELKKKYGALSAKGRIGFIRISLGIIFLWFGILKFFPSTSPAEEIAQKTMEKITLSMIPNEVNYMILANIETALGILLILDIYRKIIIPLALGHILMTFSPILFFTSEIFSDTMVPTLLGQYIIKNLVLFSSLLLISRNFCYSEETACIS